MGSSKFGRYCRAVWQNCGTSKIKATKYKLKLYSNFALVLVNPHRRRSPATNGSLVLHGSWSSVIGHRRSQGLTKTNAKLLYNFSLRVMTWLHYRETYTLPNLGGYAIKLFYGSFSHFEALEMGMTGVNSDSSHSWMSLDSANLSRVMTRTFPTSGSCRPSAPRTRTVKRSVASGSLMLATKLGHD